MIRPDGQDVAGSDDNTAAGNWAYISNDKMMGSWQCCRSILCGYYISDDNMGAEQVAGGIIDI